MARFRHRIGLVGFAVLSVVATVTPAKASSGVAQIAGTGTISPALTTTAGSHTFTFGGTGAVASDSAQGLFTCNFTGYERIGTIVQGDGNFDGSCATRGGSTTVSGTYTRKGGSVEGRGSSGGGGGFPGGFSIECAWVPTDVGVEGAGVDSYAVVCVFVAG